MLKWFSIKDLSFFCFSFFIPAGDGSGPHFTSGQAQTPVRWANVSEDWTGWSATHKP